MLIESIVADQFGTNCWVIAPQRNSECIIVDPGIVIPSMAGRIQDVVNRFSLKPIAAVLTHGHLDHTFSILPIANGYGIPALIHTQDRALIKNPMKALIPGGPAQQIIQSLGITEFIEPDSVVELEGRESLDLAGLPIQVRHAPGHTPGSSIFLVNSEYLIAGDVLFEGSIGRTDLPSGSASEMKNSLKTQVLTLDDEVIVLPGHGRQTTIGRERTRNPYLTDEFLNSRD